MTNHTTRTIISSLREPNRADCRATNRFLVQIKTQATTLVHEALSYDCIRPSATSVCRLQLLVYAAFSYDCIRPSASRVCGLNPLVWVKAESFFVHAAFS